MALALRGGAVTEFDTALLEAAEQMVHVHRDVLGWSREATKELMVHPDMEELDPGIIFNMLWPEAS